MIFPPFYLIFSPSAPEFPQFYLPCRSFCWYSSPRAFRDPCTDSRPKINDGSSFTRNIILWDSLFSQDSYSRNLLIFCFESQSMLLPTIQLFLHWSWFPNLSSSSQLLSRFPSNAVSDRASQIWVFSHHYLLNRDD